MTQSLISKKQGFLFITHKKPHQKATAQTISRWIKNTLSLAGISTNNFKAHSTRHASTSAALRRGVSVEMVKKITCWSNGSLTFFKFYNRPLYNDDHFAESILLN